MAKHGIEYYYLPIAVVRRRYLTPTGLVLLAVRLVKGTLAIRRLVSGHSGPKLIYGFTFAVIAAPFAARLLGIPLLSHSHEIFENPACFRKAIHALNVRSARAVVCVSEAVKKNILKDEPGATGRLRVVYNGITEQGGPCS